MLDSFIENAPMILGGAITFAIVLFLITRWLVNVGGTQIAVKERKYIGKDLPKGRAFAGAGEVGVQAEYLNPGLKFVPWPIVSVIKKEPFFVIGEDELGLVTASDGESMPSDRIFAEDRAGEHHNNFQDPTAFLLNGGVRGLQLRFLTNGQWKIHPDVFQVRRIKKTSVPEGKIGVVTARDGAQLDSGQLLGKRVEGHDNFQRPEIFLRNGGQKGPQTDILRPGTYNIHTDMFFVEIRDAITVPQTQIGVVEAKAGAPLGKSDVVAVAPDVAQHKNYQDGQKFLDMGGQRGPQDAVLAPGRYYINPYLFDVSLKPQTVINQGEAGVLISNIGKDPAELYGDDTRPGTGPVDARATDPVESRLDNQVRQRHVVPEGYRGIQLVTMGPGKYNINPLAYTVVDVPTNMRSVEWSANQNNSSTFDPFVVVSHDGFEMKVEVRCQYRILPENAPFVVSKLGSVEELEKNVIHPQIDGIFRAQVSKSPAISYQQNRAVEQSAAEEAVRKDLAQYKVEVVSVMITNIHLPEQLMKTTQERNLAEVSQGMFAAKREAEQTRIAYEETRARADQQAALMKATIGIDIADKDAEAKKKKAAGDAAYIEQTGGAEAKVTELKGKAQGVAFREQEAALGQGGLALVQAINAIADRGLRITPDIVAGGGADGGGSIGSVITAMLVQHLHKTGVAELPVPAAAAATEAVVATTTEALVATTEGVPALDSKVAPAKK